jgi:hypothetical protein
MQCPSCDFQNMPGNTRCLRCGASLEMATASIGVEPPRASARSKRLRKWLPSSPRIAMRLQRAWEAVPGRALEEWRRAELPANCMPRLIVPGWAQAYLGDRVPARRFFWAWLGLGLVGLVCYGSQLGELCLGGMVAVHSGSIIDACWRAAPAETQFRRGVAAAAFCGVAMIAYLIAGSNLDRLVDSRQWLEIGQPFAPGDVVLFRRGVFANEAPQPGDVVVYHSDGRVAGRVRGRNGFLQINADWVDRVIAGPGSRIRWESGQLWVDDQPSDLRPLNPERMPERLEMTVPAGAFAIFPTTHPYFAPAAETSIVPQGRILGRAIVRNYPPWRFWLLR